MVLAVIEFFTATHSLLKKKKKAVALRNVLDKAVKVINFIKFQPLRTHLNILCDELGNTHNCCCILKNDGYLEKSICAAELQVELAAFILKHYLF